MTISLNRPAIGSTDWGGAVDGNWQIIEDVLNGLLHLRGYRDGCLISRDAGDPSHDISIAVGLLRDAGDSTFLRLTSVIVKQIDAAWAAGTDQGGRPSGVSYSASTWYHVFLIKHANGTVDAGFDTSLSAANLLTASGYAYYRRVGSVLTDGSSNFLSFTQMGNDFLWSASVLDINVTNPGTSGALRTLSVPAGIKVKVRFNLEVNNGGAAQSRCYISSPDQNDEAPSTTAGPLATEEPNNGGFGMGDHDYWTNTSGQIRTRLSFSDAGVGLRIATLGWYDQLGQND